MHSDLQKDLLEKATLLGNAVAKYEDLGNEEKRKASRSEWNEIREDYIKSDPSFYADLRTRYWDAYCGFVRGDS